MFGFKKKKKTLEESSPSLASNSPASVTSVGKKSSKVSLLPFGKKSSKLKSDTASISSSETQASHGNENGQNQYHNRTSDMPPGYMVLGKLASDLEALNAQVRRDSKQKEAKPTIDVSRKNETKIYQQMPPEDWGEKEVLVWLKDNDLDYFVDLFDGCDIDGDYLLQITEEDLVELEVEDTDLRKRLLSSVHHLMSTQQDNDEDEVDISLPGLEDGGSGSDWESFEESDDVDDKRNNGKINGPTSEKELDILRPPTGFSEGHQSRLGKPIEDWTKEDVVVWLESIRLGKYSKHFLAHRVTGSKLKNIDMSLLDQMKMDSSEDRERFLSSLYDACNPHNDSKSNPQLLSSIDEASEYDKQKYLAAVRVMQSPSPRVQLIPAEPEDDRRYHQDSVYSTGSESDVSWRSDGKEKKKKKGSFTKLRDALTGMSKNPSLVRVWTDIGAAKDKPVRLKLEIEENDKVKDLINLCLESMSMVEDPRLYCIAEVCVTDNKDQSTVTDREMDDNENPLKVRRNWRESLSGHFELRQRTAQGGVIKLVLKLPGEKPKGKLVALSLSTPACELIPLALMKYSLYDEDAKEFCLLEVDSKGDLHEVNEDTLLLQQESHAYVLCKKESKAELMAISNESKAEAEQGPERSESAESLSSSHSMDVLAVKVDDEKLNQLEKEMATIEKSLQPKIGRSVSWSVNVRNNSDRTVKSSSLEVGDSDERMRYLEEENRKLLERLKEVESMEEVFNKLKVTLRHLNTENNLKLLERRRASNPDLDSLPRDLATPLFQLEGVTQEVETKQAQIDTLRREPKKGDQMEDNHTLRLEEASLVALKLEQTRLLCNMEVAMADYQMSCAKRKELAESRSLVTILPPNKQFIVFTVIVNAGTDEGYKFELGNHGNRKGIYISKCLTDGSMRIGDRVIEINNHSTFTSSVAEGNAKLNSTSKVKLVLLRETEDEDSIQREKDKNKALSSEIKELKLTLETVKKEAATQNVEQNHKKEEKDLSSILENLDDDVPLWEAIKSHSKSEILQVFQEEIQEANRQKQYLDQLYALMLEKAPELLDEMEQDLDASDVSGDEEFC